MGYYNTRAAFALWSEKIDGVAWKVFSWMAHMSDDRDDPPWYAMGREKTAMLALGKTHPTPSDLKAVSRAMKRLEAVGAITCVRKGAPRTNDYRSARYTLNLAPESNRGQFAAYDALSTVDEQGTELSHDEGTTLSPVSANGGQFGPRIVGHLVSTRELTTHELTKNLTNEPSADTPPDLSPQLTTARAHEAKTREELELEIRRMQPNPVIGDSMVRRATRKMHNANDHRMCDPNTCEAFHE